MAVIAMLN